MRWLSFLVLLSAMLGGCAQPEPPVVSCEAGGVRVLAEEPISRVELWSDGLRLARRNLAEGTKEAFVSAEGLGTVQVRVRGTEVHTSECAWSDSDATVDVRIAVPAGQEMRPLRAGSLSFVAFEGSAPELALVLTAGSPTDVTLTVGAEQITVSLGASGQREIITRLLPIDRATPVAVRAPGLTVSATLQPLLVTVDEVPGLLRLESLTFPADSSGMVDVARPAGRVTLPGRGWTRLLELVGLGVRGQDRELPWAYHAVTLSNRGEQSLDLVLRSRVLGPDGPAEAFRPVVRDADGGTGVVSALLRLPAGESAMAVLPLFITESLLPEGASGFEHELTVSPLGVGTAVLTERVPLRVSRGSSWVALGFALALCAACLGVLFAVLGVPRWLRTSSTADLTTIAVFATLGFVVTAATAVLSAGLAAVLGPFSMLVTGLLSDCLRSALLATLIVLLPRRGTATLFLLLGWLMQGIALGAFSPTDFVFVGARIFWLESFLWLAGLTRGTGWRDEGITARFLRLTVGFAGASLLSMAGAIASQIVLFRLYYATWFVLLMLALPGFLYDVLACALAVSFAASLRRVQS